MAERWMTDFLIHLTKGKFAKVDESSHRKVGHLRWCINSTGRAVRKVCSGLTGKKTCKVVYMHRELMGNPDGIVDHINGDPLDNRLSNLRIATKSQNQWNRSISKSNTSGCKGVSFDRNRGRWKAEISKNGRQTNLGYRDDLSDACQLYANASKELHGDFAVDDKRRIKSGQDDKSG